MSPRVAVRAITVHQNKILLSKYENNQGHWYVTPGGGVKKGETLTEAFTRELQEETGIAFPFREIKFIREIIASRHPNTDLNPNFHQIEINIASSINEHLDLSPRHPDRDQVGLEWIELSRLDQITFFPATLVDEFKKQSWPKFYYGDVR